MAAEKLSALKPTVAHKAVAMALMGMLMYSLTGCSKATDTAQSTFYEGSITYDKTVLTNPTFTQIDEAFKGQKWDDPNQLPMFWIGGLRITRWFDTSRSGIETFERSHRMVAVWKSESKPALQCQLEDFEQAQKLVQAFARNEDISSMLNWFEY